jgi:dimethylglycine dehydrogenase
MPGVPNAFEACVFTFGIAQGGGAGKVLAEWITEGATEWDMWSCDPRRYTDYTDHDYCMTRAWRSMATNTPCISRWHEWPAGRDKQAVACMTGRRRLGGRWAPITAGSGPTGSPSPGDDTSEEATQTWDRAGPWEPRIREECEAVRDGMWACSICRASRGSRSRARARAPG